MLLDRVNPYQSVIWHSAVTDPYWSEERENLFVWKLDQHLERLFVNMKIMRMTPPYRFDEYRQAVLDWARANRFREDVHMRLVTYFGYGGAGDVKKYRPEEIEVGAWVAGGPRPHDDALENGIQVCVSSCAASRTTRFRPG